MKSATDLAENYIRQRFKAAGLGFDDRARCEAMILKVLQGTATDG